MARRCTLEKLNWEDIIGALKLLVLKFQPQLLDKVREEIKHFPREARFFEAVMETYYNPGARQHSRWWYDRYHIPLSVRFAVGVAKNYPLVIAAVAGHDIGWLGVDPAGQKSDEHSRIFHSQEGASLIAGLLASENEVAPSEEAIFQPNEVCSVVAWAGSHDNAYLGLEEIGPSPGRRLVAEADRMFVMSFVSFWKDWALRQKKGDPITPESLLASRRKMFRRGTRFAPGTTLGWTWLNSQFKFRGKEIRLGIHLDQERFLAYGAEHLEEEIAAGRG